jgi:hypothetical protein
MTTLLPLCTKKDKIGSVGYGKLIRNEEKGILFD